MKILDIIRNDDDLQEKISLVCDFEVYDEYDAPYDYFDAEFTMNGKIFGGTDDDGWFVLLEDNTIGYISGGDIGRIAENMQEFFSLIINCPSFEDFRLEDLYYEKNKELMKKLCNGIAKKDKMYFSEVSDLDYDAVKQEICKKLNIALDNDISENTLRKFYKAATREPMYGFIEDDELVSGLIYKDELDSSYPSLEERVEMWISDEE